jgi:hypothetical protein
MTREKAIYFPALSPYDKGESNILSFIHLHNFFGFSAIVFLEEEEDVRGAWWWW